MLNYLSLLPYVLLLIAAVISFFVKKGSIVNKILCVVVFIIGMFCVFAESGWWRFGFLLLTGLVCSTEHRVFTDNCGAEIHKIMGVALSALMIIKWVIADIFDCNPFWWMLVPAAVLSIMLITNADVVRDDY